MGGMERSIWDMKSYRITAKDKLDAKEAEEEAKRLRSAHKARQSFAKARRKRKNRKK